MANYETLKAAIQNVVKTNGENEITGALLQQSLLAMINSLGAKFQFAGIAEPTTAPPSVVDQNFVYFATTPGTYSYFSGLVVGENEIALFKSSEDGWVKETLNVDNRLNLTSGYIRTDLPFSPTPTSHAVLHYAIIRVQPGEIYSLTKCLSESAVVASPYATYDDNLQLVRRCSVVDFTGDITIASNERILVVNTYKTATTQILIKTPLSTIKEHCFVDFFNNKPIRDIVPQLDHSVNGSLYFVEKGKTPSTEYIGAISRLTYAQKLEGKSGVKVSMIVRSSTFDGITNICYIYGCYDNGTVNTNVVLAQGYVNQVLPDFTIPENEYIWVLTQINTAEYQDATYDIYISDTESIHGKLLSFSRENYKLEQQIGGLNPLYGKTVVCFGDSITELYYQGKGYPEHLADMSGANVINVGIGGSLLRQRAQPVVTPTNDTQACAGLDIINMVKAACGAYIDDTHTYAEVVTNAAEYRRIHAEDDNTAIISRLLSIDWSKVDYVTVLGGSNDWKLGNTYGTYGESGTTDINTTLGAINTIIQLLLTRYPHLQIYWFTPLVRYYGNEIIDSDFSDVKTSGGKTLRELSSDIYNEAEKAHIKVCDLYNGLGWNKYNFQLYFTYDLVHPFGGFKEMAESIFKFILSK